MKNVILCILLGIAGHPKNESMWLLTLLTLTGTALVRAQARLTPDEDIPTALVWALPSAWLVFFITYLVMAYLRGRIKQLGGVPRH